MIVPGSNLLRKALSVIAPQGVQLRRATGRTTNAKGADVTAYADPVTAQGSVQAVPRQAYEAMGLDLQKQYVNFFTDVPVQTIERDESGDLIDYGGNTYACQSDTDWSAQDGWKQVLCVRVSV